MAIVTLQDLPRSPVNYSGEYVKYQELILKYTALSTTGNATWLSPSSGISYPATTGGESQLLTLLQTALSNYLLNATKWNSIQTELNKYLLLAGGTLSGFVEMNNNELRQPKIKDYTEKVVVIASATGTVNLDFSLGNVFDITLTGATTLTFSNIPTSEAHSVTLFVRQGGTAYSLTLPSSVKFSSDTVPTISDINKTSIFTLVTVNGGTRYYSSASTKFTT